MKHLLLYLLLACTLILPGACTHPTTPPVLLCADSLASANPDSAQALLASLAEGMKQEPQDVQMYYRLLCIKAKDKAYITHTSDSAILPVVEYYEREGDKKHLPEAYYYAGRVYRDLGNTLQASDYFWKALKSIKQEDNLRIKNKIYSQLGTLYSYQSMYREALNIYKAGLQENIVTQDSVSMIFSLRNIANMYRELNMPDSILPYFKRADQIANTIKRTDLSDMIQSQLASVYTELQLYDSAQIALKRALRNVERANRSGIYSIVAYYYHATGNTDSANYYYYKLLQEGNVYAKEKAYRTLAEQRIKHLDDLKLTELFNGLTRYTDSLYTLNEQASRLHSYANYNYLKNEQENVRLRDVHSRDLLIYWISGTIVVFMAGSGILYYLRRKKAMQHRLKVAEQLREEAYRRSREFMEENNRQIQALESDIERLKHQLHDSDQQKMELEQKISIIESTNRQVELEQGKRRMEEGLFFRSDIYGLFRQKVEAGKAPGQTEWEQLARQLDASFDHFTQKLLQLGLLKEKELHTCMLIKAQFKNKEMAQLLCLSPEGISSIRRRLCARFLDGKREPKEWDRFILSL